MLGSYQVADTAKPVRVTLAWTDPPPATVTGNAFVNDLDLEVSVGGRTYRGNWLAGGMSVPGGQADFRNNVENVVLPAGTGGRMSVKVVAKTLGGDGVPGNGKPLDQDFALVVSNAQEQLSSPVLVQGTATVDDTVDEQNGDGYLEPGESFALRQRVRNTGTDVATGVSATLTGNGALSVTQASSAYPDITADSDQENTTAFEGALGSAAACGVDATGLLDVTSVEGGTQSVPVSIPTGRAGPATTHSRTQTLAIPDDDAGGVVSTLFVPISGRIKDLDVRINSIDHSFVGDLKVELVSPDNATTVRLIEHVGGPNNGGDDLVDTVFDDEAATAIGSGASAAPYTGSFRPQGDQLARLDGKEQQGTWKLRVSDRYENDTGSLLAWGLTIRTAQCDPDVNPPDTAIQAAPPSLAGSRTASFEFSASKAGHPVPVPPRRRRLQPLHLPAAVRQPSRGHPHLRGQGVRLEGQRGRQSRRVHLDRRRDRARAPDRRRLGLGAARPGERRNRVRRRGHRHGRPLLRLRRERRTRAVGGGLARRLGLVQRRLRAGGRGHLHRERAPERRGREHGLERTSDLLGRRRPAARLRCHLHRGLARRRLRRPHRRALELRGRLPEKRRARRLGQDRCAPRPAPPQRARLGSGTGRVKLTRAARSALRRSRGAKATLQAVAGSVSLSKAITLRP